MVTLLVRVAPDHSTGEKLGLSHSRPWRAMGALSEKRRSTRFMGVPSGTASLPWATSMKH